MANATEILKMETLAVMNGLQPLQTEGLPNAAIAEALVRAGDALRLGMRLPRYVTEWMAGLSEADIGRATSALTEELRAVEGIPLDETPDLDTALERVACTVDRGESGAMGLVRAAMQQAVPPGQFPGFGAYRQLLDDLELRLADSFDREAVEVALGDRVDLLGPGSDWTRKLNSPQEVADEGEPSPVHDLPRLATRPPVEVVVAYLARGRHRSWVEAVAAADADFAAGLECAIDDSTAESEPTSLLSLAWRRARRASREQRSAPLVVSHPPVALAARSDGRTAGEAVTLHLGRLAPVEAEATATIDADGVTIDVFAVGDVLAGVRAGDLQLAAPNESGAWSIRVPPPIDAVRLVVVDRSGNRFEETIDFS